MRDVRGRDKSELVEPVSAGTEAKQTLQPVRTISVGPLVADRVDQGGNGESGLDLQLGFVSLSHMHQEFFRTDEPLSALYAAMERHVKDKVTVVVSYRSQFPRGWVHAELRPSALKKGVGSLDKGLVLDALIPLTTALSDYRNWVWSNRDIRIGNFNVALILKSEEAECSFTVTGDLFPPDGSKLSPCVETAGQEYCGEITDGVLRFPVAAQGALAACFAS